LFYPDNSTIFPGAQMISGVGVIKGNSLVYDFNNQTILDVTKDTPLLGNYYLGYFWENGSAVGCKKLKLYIDTYNVNMNSLFYEPILDQNILDGIVSKVYESYSMLIGTINVTDDKYYPDFYAVNNSDINQQFIYEINGEEIPILVKTFLQNETLLNPNEDIKISVTIQNLHDFVDLEVKLKVQLVSLVNEEWIIVEKDTDVKTLKPSVDPNGDDTKEFSVSLTIPTLQADEVWQGVNAPVRKGGAKTIFTVYFEYNGESHEVDTFESNEYSLVINSTQSELEGYIITLKYDEEITGASILKPFEREACQYMPNQTTFVVNIYDKNFVSSYNQFIESFSLKINSQFSDIVINPQTPIYGQKFNISSVLTTEFGDIIPNKNITCQYFDNNLWENISSQMSGANGVTSFEIDTLSLPREDDLLFRLTWQGELYILENSQNISVSLYKVSNNISLGIISNVNQITRNGKTTIKLTLNNIGDSELTISGSSISIIIEPSLTYEIVEINYLILNNFQPGESTELVISIDVTAINQMTITISVEATNELTNENITVQAVKTFEIYDVPLANYITVFFTVIMIGIFALIWAVMYLYVKRTTKKIETPIEEPSKKKPRRGRYVSVSELPKEEPKKMPAKKPSKKISKKQKQKKLKTEKPATDLDSLLEEKGLKDKK
jgi:archaellum component FlaG (FlaF/FlaG flagellin family)